MAGLARAFERTRFGGGNKSCRPAASIGLPRMTKFYFTTPLYYPNARLHAGHAYTTLVCDAFARYKRLCGYDVAFLTGTDEHGEKLERAAVKAGMTAQAFVAEKREQILNLWKLLGISYTHFIYTDRPDHTISVQRMLVGAQR